MKIVKTLWFTKYKPWRCAILSKMWAPRIICILHGIGNYEVMRTGPRGAFERLNTEAGLFLGTITILNITSHLLAYSYSR